LLVLLEDTQQAAAWHLALAGDRLVVARYKLRRTRISSKRRAALPGVIECLSRAVGKPLPDTVDALKPDPHAWSSICRERSLAPPARSPGHDDYLARGVNFHCPDFEANCDRGFQCSGSFGGTCSRLGPDRRA
jgi:hypothetical protein